MAAIPRRVAARIRDAASAISVLGLPRRPPRDRLRRLGLKESIHRLTVDRDLNHLDHHLDLCAVLPSIRIGLIDKDLEVCSLLRLEHDEEVPRRSGGPVIGSSQFGSYFELI